MKKSTIWILTIVMAFAMLGLLFMQIMYMESMTKMRDGQFSETVSRSLYGVATMLEQNETKYFLDQDLQEAEAMYSNKSLTYNNEFNISGVDTDPDLIIDGIKIQRPANFNKIKDLSDSYQSKQEILKGQYLYQKGLLNEVILTILSQSSDRPINERADSVTVRNYLKSELENNGLKMPFEFAIVSKSTGVAYKTTEYNPEDASDVYTQILFPNDPANKRYYLNVFFPTKGAYMNSTVKFMIPSFIFTFVLLVIFIFTIIIVSLKRCYPFYSCAY